MESLQSLTQDTAERGYRPTWADVKTVMSQPHPRTNTCAEFALYIAYIPYLLFSLLKWLWDILIKVVSFIVNVISSVFNGFTYVSIKAAETGRVIFWIALLIAVLFVCYIIYLAYSGLHWLFG